MSSGDDTKARKLFGTDGIRGLSNEYPMTADMVLRLGRAAGVVFRNGDHRHTVVIGKDTRLSGYMFESALQAGFTSMGIHTLLVGVLPSPAVAFLTRAFRADAGVMISASHNPFHDNGIKIFGPDGMKLPDAKELEIEEVLFSDEWEKHRPMPNRLGRATRIDDSDGRYIEFCKNTFPRHLRLDGLRVVVDCSHGAAYKVAPAVLWELGAEVIAMGHQPNGLNINESYGSLHPKRLQNKVKEVRADIGIAFDGDADRLVVCDENGQILDGDHVLAMCALEMQRNKTLKGNGVVATVMSNLGLDRLLRSRDLELIRTKVGDRYVLEHMVKHTYNLGGEQSGHLIFLDHNLTGDGLVSALKVLELLVARQGRASELAADYAPVPQVLKNVNIQVGDTPLEHPRVKEAIDQATSDLGEDGRVLVRASGTEPKIRIMVEGDSSARINALAEQIVAAVREVSHVG
ncbi:MAG: phosphoglucosamine mutase [Magnetococcales bacterium]|nr:phosphoglucosamine mutase [Magnetococcales bacterium]